MKLKSQQSYKNLKSQRALERFQHDEKLPSPDGGFTAVHIPSRGFEFARLFKRDGKERSYTACII